MGLLSLHLFFSFSHTSFLSSLPESSTISSQRSSFPTSFWTSSYQPPPPPCLSGVHPDFPVTAPGTFPTADPSSWPGHSLHQTAPPPPPAASESWHYPLASQVSPSYAHMHDVYMHRHHPHPHMHHHHPSSHRDPRYGSLLMPSVRAARIPAPQCDVTKTDPAAVTSATSAWAGAFHGTVDIVPSFGFDTGKMVRWCLWLVLAGRIWAKKWNPCSWSRACSQSLLQKYFQEGIPPEIAVRADELLNIQLLLRFAEGPLSAWVLFKPNELWHDRWFLV